LPIGSGAATLSTGASSRSITESMHLVVISES
jgi:hypothetical protein